MAAAVDARQWRGVLRRHLHEVPAFRALIRTIECRLIAEAGPLEWPLLDVGCGDGLFAELAFERAASVGIDPDAASVRAARQRGAHRLCVQTSAAALPFADATFATVVANCVLEHIPSLEHALAEIARVLRPGGRLLFGVPHPNFDRFLFVPHLCAGLGLRRLGGAYGRWFHRHSRHYHVDDLEKWRARLRRYGFVLERSRPYMSCKAHQWFDVAHYASVPRLMRRTLTGRWVGRADGPVNRWWERRLLPYVLDDPADGAYLFFETRRQSSTAEVWFAPG